MAEINKAGFDGDALINILDKQAKVVQAQVDAMGADDKNLTIGAMFKMQMLMNKLSQLSEMTGSVMAAANSATMSLARNVKG